MMTRIVDSLVFVGQSRYGGGQDLGEFLARRDHNQDTAVCVSAMPLDRDLWRQNSQLVSAARERSDVVPLIRVDPHDADAVPMANDLLASGGRGLFLHPWEETFSVTDDRVVGPVMKCAAERGVPVVVEAGFPGSSELTGAGGVTSGIRVGG